MKVTITQATSAVVASNDTERAYLIRNETGTADVYLETDAAATVASGFHWKTSDPALQITLEAGQTLNAIVAASGANQELRLLRSGH